MAGQRSLSPHCTIILLVALQFATAYGGPEELSSCPSNQVCTKEKCGSLVDGSKSCCVCELWSANGGCSLNGWREKAGGGDCTLNDYPMAGMHLIKCPSGVKCAMSKCKGTGEEETCCKCLAWDKAGSCRDDSWTLVKGTGGCSVAPGDGSIIWFGEMLEQMKDKESATSDAISADESTTEEPLIGATIMDHDAQVPKNQSEQTSPPETSAQSENAQKLEGDVGDVANSTEESNQVSSLVPVASDQPVPALNRALNTTQSEARTEDLETRPLNSNTTESVAPLTKDEGSAVPTADVVKNNPLEGTVPSLYPSLPVPTSDNAPDTDQSLELQSDLPSNNTISSTSNNDSLVAPSPGEPLSNVTDSTNPAAIELDIPNFAAPICAKDGDCGKPICQGEGPEKTCCVCNGRDQSGKCLPNKWKVTSGAGTCDFIQPDMGAHELPVAIPKRGSAAPEEFVDLLPFTPCPKGVTCQTTKCAIRDGIEACCDCWVWSVSGKCSENGWKPRGKGDCSFAFT